ncbi:NDR1/HIN1-like protein 13 [Magnolia sinica]|uniref:NDR1/HIN1-like protein 13 n=1 Tax=Magnolia sinica TaxID=86752 RepID=UPI00265B51BD|nr:NDR1/HIN1-like protein 13 [Magnolia sinica]
MTDRVYPSSKPSVNPNPSNPTPKPNLYRPPVYRPTPPKRRRGNRCCICCIWFIIVLLSLILLAAIAACIMYVLYRPHPPSFSVSSARFSSFNLTSTHLNLSISARNPNKNLVFFYEPFSVAVSSDGAHLGDGSFTGFVHETKNTTLMRASVSTGGAQDLDSDSIKKIESGLKKKNGLPLEIRLQTKVRVKMGGWKTKKVGIRVTCDGISASVSKSKSTAAASADGNAKCKVKLWIKIWKWEV